MKLLLHHHRFTLFLLFAGIFTVGLTEVPGLSDVASGAEFTSVRLAFRGQGRVGHALPVIVEASGLEVGRNVQLQVRGPDPRGNLVTDLISAGRSDGNGAIRLEGTFRVGRLDGQLQISLVDAESKTVLADRGVPISRRELTDSSEPLKDSAGQADDDVSLKMLLHTSQCLLTVGSPAGVSEMEQAIQRQSGRDIRFTVLRVPSVRDLPVSPDALESVDWLLLTDDFSCSQEQVVLIRDWVSTGGNLLVSSGASVATLLESPVGRWLQPYFEIASTPGSIRELTVLQNYVTGAKQLQTLSRPVAMSYIRSPQVRVVVNSLEGPLVGRRAVGGGTITFVALDVNQRPLSGWASLDKFFTTLVYDRSMESATVAVRQGSRISSSGISDLSTQLANAHDAIPASDRWSAWQIMSFIAIYLIIVGPLDYVLVVHFLKTPHLTWVTFPVFVGLGCAFAWWQYDSNSPAISQRQIHLLDVSSVNEGQVLVARSWTSVSTQETRRADVDSVALDGFVPKGVVPAAPRLHWAGRAEDVYGGMYREGGAGIGRQSYVRTELSPDEPVRLTGVPMLAGGSQAFSASSILTVPGAPLVESQLTVSGSGLLEGDVITRFPYEIRNWTVLFGSRVYQPSLTATDEERIIHPGQTWNRRESFVRASDLKSWLNGTRIIQTGKLGKNGVRADSIQVTTPYNPRGTDPLDIFTMASMYEFAGGHAFVGLSNDSLRHLEVSETIRLNSALLMGVIEPPLADFRIDGQSLAPIATQTVIRVLLPVVRLRAAPAADTRIDNNSPAPDEVPTEEKTQESGAASAPAVTKP